MTSIRHYQWAAFILLILLPALFASCQQSASSVPLQKRIPPADPSKYREVRDYLDWKNPYLLVKADGIEFVRGASGHSVAVDSVPAILDDLPKSAWPFGLIVAVQEAGLRGVTDTPRINANRDKLLRLLKGMGVAVFLWPSA